MITREARQVALDDSRPIVVLSQDYELFFHRSGTPERCLFEPTDSLLAFARQRDSLLTFYVDAGMLVAMRRLRGKAPAVERMYTDICRHIGTVAAAGHEIGLHVHPHWEDTRWHNGWDFSGSRYRLGEFDSGAGEIVERYGQALMEIADVQLYSYRAGGFCIEPFAAIRPALLKLGISVDSSVVPGTSIRDPQKGFDFRHAPRQAWWEFDESPAVAAAGGAFLELAVTPVKLPFFHYWQRVAARLAGVTREPVAGDGSAKRLGRLEILRRLAGGGRASELSVDGPKATSLVEAARRAPGRSVWQVMGHPKMLSAGSLHHLATFMELLGTERTMTVESVAAAARQGEVPVY